MEEGAQNHYQVLRIERTADERTIKKAYFTLIREFPPDTHPEEFKAIRAAYEVLSDPVARQRFDDAEKDFGEYGGEIGSALKEIEQIQKDGDEPEVQRRLLALVAEHPDLVIAREKLAFAYLRANAFKEALEQWKALAKAKPEEARYHYFRGLAHNRLKEPGKAFSAVKTAHKLKPEDLGIHLALIDLLKGERKLDEALNEIDIALEQHGKKREHALVLCLRKADAYLSLGDADDAREVVDELKELIREMNDPELPKYVSSQLAAIAANLFGGDEPGRANEALKKCEEIYPESPVDHPYPAVTDLDVSALPEAGVAWLAKQTPGNNSPTLAEGIWGLLILSLVGAAVAAAILISATFTEPSAWGVAEALAVAALLIGLALWVGSSVRAILGILRSPLRAFTTLHPLYLLRVRADRIRVYPLFRLSNIRAIHQHTNGGYTHTAVSISFGTEIVNVTLRGKDFAEGWVQFLVGNRVRALELMGEGYLEAEHGVELIPPALLTKASRQKAEKGERLRWHGRAAAAGSAAALLTIAWHSRAADNYAYRLAVRGHSFEAYTAYLGHSPTGHHAEDAKRARARIVERAADEFRAAAKPDAPGSKAILGALDALALAGTVDVPVTVQASVNAAGNADLGNPQGSFGNAALAERGADLVERLGRTLGGAGLSEVMHLKLSQDPVDAPVTITIRPRIGPEDSVLRAEGVTVIPSVKVEWEVTLAKRGVPEPLLRFATTVESPALVELARPASLASSAFARTALDALADNAFDALADGFARELGLPGAARKSPRKDGAGR